MVIIIPKDLKGNKILDNLFLFKTNINLLPTLIDNLCKVEFEIKETDDEVHDILIIRGWFIKRKEEENYEVKESYIEREVPRKLIHKDDFEIYPGSWINDFISKNNKYRSQKISLEKQREVCDKWRENKYGNKCKM